MSVLLAATGNQHKLRELRQILAPHGIEVLGADDVSGIPEVIEDGDVFAENAVKKACQVARAKHLPVIADDSGLEVNALAGAPGVYSARYAGPAACDQDNVDKLLGQLKEIGNRRARFVCVIAVARADGTLLGTATGTVAGEIIQIPRGRHGFGYDPVFVPNGCQLTFAELPADVKNSLSHRANALRQALAQGLFTEFET